MPYNQDGFLQGVPAEVDPCIENSKYKSILAMFPEERCAIALEVLCNVNKQPGLF